MLLFVNLIVKLVEIRAPDNFFYKLNQLTLLVQIFGFSRLSVLYLEYWRLEHCSQIFFFAVFPNRYSGRVILCSPADLKTSWNQWQPVDRIIGKLLPEKQSWSIWKLTKCCFGILYIALSKFLGSSKKVWNCVNSVEKSRIGKKKKCEAVWRRVQVWSRHSHFLPAAPFNNANAPFHH